MPNTTQRTKLFSQADLAALERRLERIVGRIRDIREEMADLKVDGIYIFSHRTLEAGLNGVDSFPHSVVKSWEKHESGQPYGPDSLKTRSGAKKRTRKKKS